jgi:thiol-disulfide isomerase/thioredoxin
MKTLKNLFAAVLLLLSGLPCLAGDYKALEIGAPAPDFNLKGIDGKQYTLKSFAKAKVLAVIFTCNHCPSAQAYEERIKALVSDYKDKDVAIIAINPNDPLALRLDELGYSDLNDSYEEMKIRAKEKQFNFIYLYDGETKKHHSLWGGYYPAYFCV